MIPDQTTLLEAVWSGSTLFVKEASKCFSRQQKHTTFCGMRFKGWYIRGQCIYGQYFHEMHARLRGPKSLLSLNQIINKSWFQFLKAQFSLCRCSHGSSRCRTAGIPWCTGTHLYKKITCVLTLPTLPGYSPGSRESKTPVDPRFTKEHLRCSTVEPRFVPVYPGVTQVVYGDVPVTAGCATVTCR